MEEIELRSEKVRNIMGVIPPYIIKTGITTIIILSAIIFISCSIISIPVFIDCDVTINKDKLSIQRIRLDRGVEVNETIKKNTPLEIILENQNIYNVYFDADISKLSVQNDGIYINNPSLYIPKILSLGNISYSIDDNIILRGRIRLRDINLLSHLLEKI